LMKGHARGAWLGLHGAHARADLARAAGEGVVAAIAEAIDALVGAATSRGPLRAAGGGVRHAAFAQAIADASGHAIEVRDVHDASGLGAALLGGIAVGAYADLADAAARAPARVAASYAPDRAEAEAWAARRSTLRELDAIGVHEVVRPRG
jgi:sugar (pentulose or hexulose) kinase